MLEMSVNDITYMPLLFINVVILQSKNQSCIDEFNVSILVLIWALNWISMFLVCGIEKKLTVCVIYVETQPTKTVIVVFLYV